MPDLKASTVQYNFSLDEIKKMLAKELTVPEEVVTVTYNMVDVSDERDKYSRYVVGSVSVTIDNTKIKN